MRPIPFSIARQDSRCRLFFRDGIAAAPDMCGALERASGQDGRMRSSRSSGFLPATVCLGLFASVALGAVAGTPTPPVALLRALRQAHGGARWLQPHALIAEGKETGEGMEGPWSQVVELGTGHYLTRARTPIYSSADGLDAQGRWHQDISGLVHPYDSKEAQAGNATVSWLLRFGYLTSPERSVKLAPLPEITEQGRRFQRLEATPVLGRPVTLWIDAATHRLDRAVWLNSFQVWTQRYADYREVEGLLLPFRITTEVGTPENAAVDVVERYQVLARVPADRLRRPDGTVRDVTLAKGATRAVSPLKLEGGLLLVWASINGKPAMPFILDTGGHAILTTAAARKLGLKSVGKGVGFGSGPGSMSTAYTRVDHLRLGEADLGAQTFLVMPYPYSLCQRGMEEPVAGLLGLEIFERFAVTLDYDHERAIFEPFDHGAPPAVGKGRALRLRFTDDMPLVEAKVEDRRGTFGLDTGNGAYTLVFPQWAAQVGLAARYALGLPVPTGGVGGRYTAHVSHAETLELGESKLYGPLVMLTRADAGATGNPSEAGNIGQDVLSRFNVRFDYRRQAMYLTPRAHPPKPQTANAGFGATKEEKTPDRFKVTWVLEGGPAAKAGLKEGDVVLDVNGTPAAKLGFGALQDLIGRKPEGTRVRLRLADGRTVKIALRDLAPR
jgi:hypothetical protein